MIDFIDNILRFFIAYGGILSAILITTYTIFIKSGFTRLINKEKIDPELIDKINNVHNTLELLTEILSIISDTLQISDSQKQLLKDYIADVKFKSKSSKTKYLETLEIQVKELSGALLDAQHTIKTTSVKTSDVMKQINKSKFDL